MNGTGENRAVRLRRLADRADRSREVYQDDLRAFHAEAELAFDEHSVRWVATAIGKSVTQTFRIINRITGPRARD